jgi:uncharacterized DUF497 family protein
MHEVSFDEAASAFRDPLSLTIPDPDHSEEEERYLLLGQSTAGRLVVVSHTERGAKLESGSSVHGSRNRASDETMKKEGNDELRKEYDFSKGVRGKYADRFAEGTKLVLLDPDVAEAFPTAKSVNTALRNLLEQQSLDRK